MIYRLKPEVLMRHRIALLADIYDYHFEFETTDFEEKERKQIEELELQK